MSQHIKLDIAVETSELKDKTRIERSHTDLKERENCLCVHVVLKNLKFQKKPKSRRLTL